MCLGLQLQFYRDLCPHYGYANGDADPKQIAQWTEWTVLGHWDYLTIRQINDFAEFASISHGSLQIKSKEIKAQEENQQTLLSGPLCFNLLKSPLFPGSASVNANEWNSSPMLLVVQLSVSSVTFNAFTTYDELLIAMTKIESKVATLLQAEQEWLPKSDVYWTLGSQDFVALLAISNEGQIPSAMGVVQLLRQILFVDVFGDLDSPKHHVFAGVNAQFAFKTSYTDELHNRSPADSTIFLRSNVTISPGHEEEYLGDSSLQLSWNSASLTVSFSTIAEYSKWLDNNCLNVNGHRKQDIGNTYGEILFSKDVLTTASRNDSSHDQIDLNDHIKKLRNEIRNGVISFTSRSVGPSQGIEIQKTIDAICAALGRNECLGAVRDLLPFLRRLSECLGSDRWANYLLCDSYSSQRVSQDLTRLTEHSWIAIRNRIESKSDHFDPMYSSSLNNGCVKLMNAYTVAAWLCWDVLSRATNADPRKLENVSCDAENFAACVCAGSSGRVECEKVFDEFISIAKPNDSSTPLLLLSISGPVLFRPEAAIAHCLHEMAEFSMWIEQAVGPPSLHELRGEISKFISWIVEGYVFDLILHSESVFLKNHILQEEGRTNVTKLLQYAVIAEHNQTVGELFESIICSDPWEKAQTVFKQIIASTPLDDVEELLMRSWLGMANNEKFGLMKRLGGLNASHFDSLQQELNGVLRASTARQTTEAPSERFTIASFRRRCEVFVTIVREAFADFGMVLAISRMLKETNGIGKSILLTSHINYMFAALIESLYAWLPSAAIEIALKTILPRWATLHRATRPTTPYLAWRGLFEMDFVRYCVDFSRAVPNPPSSEYYTTFARSILDESEMYCVFNRVVKHDSDLPHNRIEPHEESDNTSLFDIFGLWLSKQLTDGVEKTTWWPADGTPQHKLLSEFLSTWNLAVVDAENSTSSIETSHARTRLVLSFWAKSQKLVLPKVF